ncbi:hypothetical protein FRP1_26410 [Pseudonocardia sp. EC080625-04]|nr:hypothetical protein FRP1_26410 [Pseudonocardia sp. EC080625-04]
MLFCGRPGVRLVYVGFPAWVGADDVAVEIRSLPSMTCGRRGPRGPRGPHGRDDASVTDASVEL